MRKLGKGEAYYMLFSSGYNDYFSIGNELEIMAENILNRYNKYCVEYDQIHSLEEMAKFAKEEGYHFNTYLISLNTACDMDYRNFENEVFLGDYLEYRKVEKEKGRLDDRIAEAKDDINRDKKQPIERNR